MGITWISRKRVASTGCLRKTPRFLLSFSLLDQCFLLLYGRLGGFSLLLCFLLGLDPLLLNFQLFRFFVDLFLILDECLFGK